MTTHEQILDYLATASPDATAEERALHVLMLSILGNAPESLRLKEPKGTYTKGDMVLSDATAQHEGNAMDLRLALYRTRRAEKARSPFDAIGLFLAMEGQRVQMSRVMGGNEPAEFVGLKWAHPDPVMVMACCPTVLLIVRRLPKALSELLRLVNAEQAGTPPA